MRLSTLTMFLFLGACTISSTGGDPASVECTTGADGEMICTQTGEDEERPDGEENEGDEPRPDGEQACSSEECVVHCEEGGVNEDGSESNVVHCVIECANGLRCDQVCTGESCSLSCTCPEGDDQPTPECSEDNPEGCENTDPCQDRPDSADCQPQGDYCDEHPEADECQEGGGEPGCENTDDPACCNHDTDAAHEEFCQENPDSAECR